MTPEEARSKYEGWLIVSRSETWNDLAAKIQQEEERLLERLRNATDWQAARFIQGQLHAWRVAAALMKEPEEEYKNTVAQS